MNIAITQETLTYIVLGLIVSFVILLIWNVRIEIRLSRLLRGKKARSLEDTILTLGKETDSLHAFKNDMEKYLLDVETRLRKSTSGIATVRFNPFKGVGAGGNQSFATAFIDENGNGVVISSLYSRERVSIFAKPIEKFKSEHKLTKEEKEAIKQASSKEDANNQ